jgi:hypothetical protein
MSTNRFHRIRPSTLCVARRPRHYISRLPGMSRDQPRPLYLRHFQDHGASSENRLDRLAAFPFPQTGLAIGTWGDDLIQLAVPQEKPDDCFQPAKARHPGESDERLRGDPRYKTFLRKMNLRE